MTIINVQKEDFSISTDIKKLDIATIHDYLSNHAYWSKHIPFETVKKATENSLNFGVFHQDKQVGYARIISDFASIAYLGDVFILPEYRGKGLSKWPMEQIMAHPDLQNLRRWILLTRDAHNLYKQFGWKEIAKPEAWMEIHYSNVYKESNL